MTEQTLPELLQSDLLTEPTRRALLHRLNAPPRQPTFFQADDFARLQAVCARLIPQNNRPAAEQIDVAGGIDERLAANKSDGWRYDNMPPDGDACLLGLLGIEQSATAMFGRSFCQLTDDQQDAVLTAVQTLDAPGAVWQSLPADRFFEDLLAEATTLYYCHPLAQAEIGYVGMTDAPGWQRIGLNELEKRELLIIHHS
jgi:gluconate 2-dehydrogenase gamma chain